MISRILKLIGVIHTLPPKLDGKFVSASGNSASYILADRDADGWDDRATWWFEMPTPTPENNVTGWNEAEVRLKYRRSQVTQTIVEETRDLFGSLEKTGAVPRWQIIEEEQDGDAMIRCSVVVHLPIEAVKSAQFRLNQKTDDFRKLDSIRLSEIAQGGQR